jgi:hypothetical protein
MRIEPGVDVGGERPTLVALGTVLELPSGDRPAVCPDLHLVAARGHQVPDQFGVAALPAPDPMTTRSSPRRTYINMTGRRSPPDRPTTSSRNTGRPTKVLPFRTPLDRYFCTWRSVAQTTDRRDPPGDEVRDPGGHQRRGVLHRVLSPEPSRKASAVGTYSSWCRNTPAWPESG